MHIAKNQQLFLNRSLKSNGIIDEFIKSSYVFTSSGKMAIELALQYYNLKPEDNVWIVTTSGNKYISGCVTKAIEKHCNWSRVYMENTKVIFVNHEFGYPFTNFRDLSIYNLPIIEDVAHSFFSSDGESTTLSGDFVIYSLPKYFPVQFGGIIKINNGVKIQSDLHEDSEKYLKAILEYYLQDADEIKSKRLKNYHYYKDLFSTVGATPHFEIENGIIPGVFMFNTPDIDGSSLKKYMQGNGVESSVFYGREAFFVPINQMLEYEHLEFIFSLYQIFLDGNL